MTVNERELVEANALMYAEAAWEEADEHLAKSLELRSRGDLAGSLDELKAAEYCRKAAVLALRRIGWTTDRWLREKRGGGTPWPA